jgi:BirA family transcriptional regulator, biotin operon repressor / biotin---[acetyl-CoA-carboxylase] ligase
MLIIKLNATESTNDYLKQINREKKLENFTIVTAFSQTKGKGQMGAQWNSEPGKNLTFSVLYKSNENQITSIFDMNVAVAVSIIQALESFEIPKLNIKWPNDILAENKKIGGILIENNLKADATIATIIGIGINVNQEFFPDFVQAGSLKSITSKEYNLDELLEKIVSQIQSNLVQINSEKDYFWQQYHHYLFKRNQPMAFENTSRQKFMGIIKEVTTDGKLQVQLEDDAVQSFGIKEIKMLF